jgi:hypothetical protein
MLTLFRKFIFNFFLFCISFYFNFNFNFGFVYFYFLKILQNYFLLFLYCNNMRKTKKHKYYMKGCSSKKRKYLGGYNPVYPNTGGHNFPGWIGSQTIRGGNCGCNKQKGGNCTSCMKQMGGNNGLPFGGFYHQ